MAVLHDGKLVSYDKTIFGNYKATYETDKNRYIVHNDIGITDEYENIIFEGDVCKCPNGSKGVVAYSGELGTYCIFDYNEDTYYVLTDETGSETVVVGNVIEG